MSCNALWQDNCIRIGDQLTTEYRARLVAEGLLGEARIQSGASDAGGATRDETDRHFAQRFSNSAGRAVYVSIDPPKRLEDLANTVTDLLIDGVLLFIEVPCGCGAGALGVISSVYERRKAGLLPTSPLRIKLLGGDISSRAMDHLHALVAQMSGHLAQQGIHVEPHLLRWNAADLVSTSKFIDEAVRLAGDVDQAFLFVSNFSDALTDASLKDRFQHFLGQFGGRMHVVPHFMCWVEPNTKGARKLLPAMMNWLSSLFGRLTHKSESDWKYTAYDMQDPITDAKYGTGVAVVRATHGGARW